MKLVEKEIFETSVEIYLTDFLKPLLKEVEKGKKGKKGFFTFQDLKKESNKFLNEMIRFYDE